MHLLLFPVDMCAPTLVVSRQLPALTTFFLWSDGMRELQVLPRGRETRATRGHGNISRQANDTYSIKVALHLRPVDDLAVPR